MRKLGSLSDSLPITVLQVPGFTRVWVNRHGRIVHVFVGLYSLQQGKGYPDIATRQLVKTLSDNLPDE